MLSFNAGGFLFILFGCGVTSSVGGRCPQQPRCSCSVNEAIVKVDCSGKGFTTIPDNLPRNTTDLIISNNPLVRLPANSFIHVNHLSRLFIENASLEYINVTAFKGLDVLESLSLRNNVGLGIYNNSVNPEVFKDVSNLRTFLIDQNSPSATNGLNYPDIFVYLTELEELAIDGVSEQPFGSWMLNLSNLKSLNFSGEHGLCNLTHIRSDFFEHIPHLENISLQYCNIEYIDPNAFLPLYKIFRLDLSFNERFGLDGFEVGSESLTNSTISELILNKLYPTFGVDIQVTVLHMQWLKNTTLKRLELNSNRLESVASEVLSDTLPNTITSISIVDNKMSVGPYIFAVYCLNNLQNLDMSGMYSFHSVDMYHMTKEIDTRCHTTCKETFPESHLLSVYHGQNCYQNRLQENYPLPVPQRLVYVNATHMNLKYMIPNIWFENNIVEKVDLHDNTLYLWQGPIYGMTALKWLDLSNNFCTNVSDFFFSEFVSLETLLIQRNLLGFSLAKDEEGNIFSHLQNLSYLNLSDNKINYIPVNLFRSLWRLSWLDLSENRLRKFNISFKSLHLIQHLDLSDNFLTSLPNSVCNDLDHFGDKSELLLGGNPLLCSCETLPFLRWLSSTKVKIVSMNKLHCTLELNDTLCSLKDIQDLISLLERSCRDYAPFILIGCSGLVLSSIAMIAMVIRRYRWKLRYFYYVSRAKYQGEPGHRDYIYDAFISYADEDRLFVHNELIDILENEAGLRLCIHHRDFIPGRWVEDNIAGAIYNSRKCIFLLSKYFFESYWCQYEYNMARVEEMHSGRDILILVNFKHVPARMIPAEVWEQMEIATYVTYYPDQRNERFWTNIRSALAS